MHYFVVSAQHTQNGFKGNSSLEFSLMKLHWALGSFIIKSKSIPVTGRGGL
jgi:hypothetical protein